MIFQHGDAGWVLFSAWGENDDLVARVRFAERPDGRLEPAEVYVEGSVRLTGETLRSLPLGHMEAMANGHERAEILRRIAESGLKVDRATDRWLTIVGGGDRHMVLFTKDVKEKLRRRALQLRIPDEPKKPDSFYVRVAQIYTALADSGSRRPAQEIADANSGVPVTTVHRWIREARSRGMLPSGRRGKAG